MLWGLYYHVKDDKDGDEGGEYMVYWLLGVYYGI